MSDQVTIRRGVTADVNAVTVIGQASPTAPRWQLSDYNQIIPTKRTLLVAECDDKIVGFIIGRDIMGEWELENVVVGDDFRHRGTGKRLVVEFVLEAKTRNAKFIFLEVRESNVAAKRLYERCGFQQYGRRKQYYSNPPEDAVLYRFLGTPAALENLLKRG